MIEVFYTNTDVDCSSLLILDRKNARYGECSLNDRMLDRIAKKEVHLSIIGLVMDKIRKKQILLSIKDLLVDRITKIQLSLFNKGLIWTKTTPPLFLLRFLLVGDRGVPSEFVHVRQHFAVFPSSPLIPQVDKVDHFYPHL